MGCDIHMRCEVLSRTNGTWEDADYYRKSRWADREFEVVPVYDARNYDLFAILANVRNDPSWDGRNLEYISEPRGIPEDCNEAIKEAFELDRDCCHSFSYYTLRELMEYDKTHHGVWENGMISPEQAEALDKRGELPNQYCKWTNIEGYVQRSWFREYQILEPIITTLKNRMKEIMWIWDEDIEKNADNIRIVFWFDN